MTTAVEMDKDKLMNNTFRRSSITSTTGGLKIEIAKMPDIMLHIGQSVNLDKLWHFCHKLDPEKTGFLDREGYDKVCKEFVKDPAILLKVAGPDFLDKQLIKPGDFASP